MSRRLRSFFSELVNATKKKVLHDGKQCFIEGIGQYSQSLFDEMWSEHVVRVEKIRILSRRSRWNCPYITNTEHYKNIRFCLP